MDKETRQIIEDLIDAAIPFSRGSGLIARRVAHVIKRARKLLESK